MDVQQGGANPDDGPGTTGEGEGSRVGLIVGVAAVLLIGLIAVVVLLNRDDAGDSAATPTPTVASTVTPSPTATATVTVTPTPSPTSEQGEFPDLRADGLGELMLRMTKQQALDTGLVTEVETDKGIELIADPEALPGVFVCWDAADDLVTSLLVKDGSPITTPDGIGVNSTPDDLRAAYGVLLQEREENGEVFFAVPVDDVGYVFFPNEVEMPMLAGTDQVVAEIVPGTEPC